MKRMLFSLILFGFIQTAFAQNFEYYNTLSKADSLYQSKDYKASALCYSRAININHSKISAEVGYNAACSWSLAGVADSAFYYLKFIVRTKKYSNLKHITNDSDLNLIHDDKRWLLLIDEVKTNSAIADAKLNKPLVNRLDSIRENDQRYRMKYDETGKRFGFESKQYKALLSETSLADSINLIKVKEILNKYGWLGPDIIGNNGSLTLFLVIQHADLKSQIKYLPMMEAAVKNEKASAANLALLQDRIQVMQGKKQIYGSQIYSDPKTGKQTIGPIDDEENVDKRRASVGLQPLELYAKIFGIKYTLPAKKK